MVLKNLQAKWELIESNIEYVGLECGEYDSLFATVENMIFMKRYDLANKILDMIAADVTAKRTANGE